MDHCLLTCLHASLLAYLLAGKLVAHDLSLVEQAAACWLCQWLAI